MLSKLGTCLTFHVSSCFLSKAGSGLSTINSAKFIASVFKSVGKVVAIVKGCFCECGGFI